MTRERKILKGPRKGEMETVIVPVAMFEVLDVHETYDFKCADGTCNQAGFLPHEYIQKEAHHLETRFRHRRSASLPRPTPPPRIAPPQMLRRNLQWTWACASRRVKLRKYRAELSEIQIRRPDIKFKK